MKIVTNPPLAPTPLPGIHHATLAGMQEGLSSLSLWNQILEPGAGTPPHRHDCDEVVLCVSGHGEVLFSGCRESFGPNTTLCIPGGSVHQILNTGSEPMQLIAAFAQSPVGVYLPDGEALELPWRS